MWSLRFVPSGDQWRFCGTRVSDDVIEQIASAHPFDLSAAEEQYIPVEVRNLFTEVYNQQFPDTADRAVTRVNLGARLATLIRDATILAEIRNPFAQYLARGD